MYEHIVRLKVGYAYSLGYVLYIKIENPIYDFYLYLES